MPLLDKDVATWVCPEAHEVQEYVVGRAAPNRTICSECGLTYEMACIGLNCSDRRYHPSDWPTRFHPCGATIAWASARRDRIENEWPDWQTALLRETYLQPVTIKDALERRPAANPPVTPWKDLKHTRWDHLGSGEIRVSPIQPALRVRIGRFVGQRVTELVIGVLVLVLGAVILGYFGLRAP